MGQGTGMGAGVRTGLGTGVGGIVRGRQGGVVRGGARQGREAACTHAIIILHAPPEVPYVTIGGQPRCVRENFARSFERTASDCRGCAGNSDRTLVSECITCGSGRHTPSVSQLMACVSMPTRDARPHSVGKSGISSFQRCTGERPTWALPYTALSTQLALHFRQHI